MLTKKIIATWCSTNYAISMCSIFYYNYGVCFKLYIYSAFMC